jgi:hypothetical protein
MTEPETDGPTLVSRRSLGILTSLLTLAFGAVISFGATEFNTGWTERGPEPGYFPFWIGLVIIAGSIGTLVQAIMARNDGAVPAITSGQARRATTFALPMLGFVALTHFLGLYVATIIYLFVVMIWQGGYGLPAAAAVSLGTAVTLYFMFDKWLLVPLAKGPIEAWLGIY